MITLRPKTSVRPYWHVDLKWIFGLLALFALSTALLTFNLSSLTERDQAINLSASVVASLFSKDGLDDTSGLDEFRQKAAATPGETITPIEQFPWLHISKNDALTLGPRDLRLTIFKQITTPIYDKGLEGAAADITPDPAEQAKFTKDASLLGAMTKTTHDAVQRFFYISAVATIVLLGAAIYFSAGVGRLVTPGVLLLAVSPVGTIAGLLLLHPPKDGDAPLASLPSTVTLEVGRSLSHSYLVVTLLGVFLLLMALAVVLIKKSRRAQKISSK